jgi:hypothetical protein
VHRKEKNHKKQRLLYNDDTLAQKKSLPRMLYAGEKEKELVITMCHTCLCASSLKGMKKNDVMT